MNILNRISAILLSVVLSTLTVGIAHARTPTPAVTPISTPIPAATSTPSPQQIARFSGRAWVEGNEFSGPLTAWVGNTQCGEGESIFIPEGVLVYNVAVLSSEARPGCGYEGATVTFLLGGQQATRTGVWRSGSFQIMPFIAGHPFALFGGFVNTDRSLSNEVLVPYVGDKACGYTKWGDGGGYEAAVYSNEQEPGCGTEGAEVTFKLLDAQGNVIAVAPEKGVWHAWDPVAASQQLNLTMAPLGGPSIKIGNVGTGGSQQSGTLWREMSLVLAAVGLGGIAAGAALRRRGAAR